MLPWLHPIPDFEPEYFSAHLTSDPAREPVAVGSSIPRTIADAAINLFGLGSPRPLLTVRFVVLDTSGDLARRRSNEARTLPLKHSEGINSDHAGNDG
jgi:hypothetical protein